MLDVPLQHQRRGGAGVWPGGGGGPQSPGGSGGAAILRPPRDSGRGGRRGRCAVGACLGRGRRGWRVHATGRRRRRHQAGRTDGSAWTTGRRWWWHVTAHAGVTRGRRLLCAGRNGKDRHGERRDGKTGEKWFHGYCPVTVACRFGASGTSGRIAARFRRIMSLCIRPVHSGFGVYPTAGLATVRHHLRAT